MNKRWVAMLGILASLTFLTLTIALITFAQVLPALATFGITVTLALFSLPAFLIQDDEEPENASEPAGTSDAMQADETPAPWNSTRVVSSFLAAIFAYAAILQLVGARFVVGLYALWHYPFALRWAVGVVEAIAAVALAFPSISKVGALLMMPVMLGAIYTHLFRGVPSLAVVPALLLVPLVFVYWEQSALRERLGHAH